MTNDPGPVLDKAAEKIARFIGGSLGVILGTVIEATVYSAPLWVIFTLMLGYGIPFNVFWGWSAFIVLAVRVIAIALKADTD
jgi:high-affinity Fe2+/Pb2+ permease